MKYLKLKKTSPEERRKKMKEGTRVASNERRLIIQFNMGPYTSCSSALQLKVNCKRIFGMGLSTDLSHVLSRQNHINFLSEMRTHVDSTIF